MFLTMQNKNAYLFPKLIHRMLGRMIRKPRESFFLNEIIYRTATETSMTKDEVAFSNYEVIPVSNIRNFSIIAHVDHGKSTLADRLLEFTGTLNVEPGKTQVLDRLQVEQDRGITVKAVTASLQYRSKKNNREYLLNLVDTPGHVDFSNEVARALVASQAVILLVDANEGVQAQTYANFYLAFVKDMCIIPALNKVDLKHAKPDVVEEQLQHLFDINKADVMRISAKFGTGVEDLIERIIEKAPPPPANRDAPLKALLFDCWFEKYRGVIILLYIQDGEVKEGDIIHSHHTNMNYVVKDVGIVRPNEYRTGILKGGQVGYVSCNMQSVANAHIGDTFCLKSNPVEPFPGFKPLQPMVFAGLYPVDPSETLSLKSAIEKLTLTDSAVTVESESSPALGHGWRLGFLGLLHLEVFNQRLDQEYDAQTIMTAPSVTYKVRIKGEKNIKKYRSDELIITNPSNLPDPNIITEALEPTVLGTIVTPAEYLNAIAGLCHERRGIEKSLSAINNSRCIVQYIMPLNEVIVDFHDRLKNISSGFASFDYEDNGYVISDLTKMDFLINGEPVEELSMIVHKSKVRQIGSEICSKLAEVIPRQQFKIAIQAAVGGKIFARENIQPYRKNVTAKLYGGDATRRMKLLRNQAEAKKKMRMGSTHRVYYGK